MIDNNKLVVFSQTYCPFCKRAKALLTDLGVLDKAKVFELDIQQDGNTLQNAMAKRTGGIRSVPEVFIDGEYIGGALA